MDFFQESFNIVNREAGVEKNNLYPFSRIERYPARKISCMIGILEIHRGTFAIESEEQNMWKEAVWIGVPSGELERCHILEGDLTGRFAYYRLEVELTEVGKLEVDITANSRYRLWVNGKAVLSGPCKGDKDRCYYDTVELTDYLKPGKNILAVQVLYCNPDTADDITKERASIIGVLTPAGGHRLVMEGDICDQDGKVMQTVTTGKADWRVYLDGSFYLKSNEILINMGAICEEIDLHQTPSDWKKEEYDAGTWCRAENRENAADTDFTKRFGFLPRFLLCERTIPLMYETEDSFEEELETSCIKKTGILKTGAFLVNPGEERVILLDAGRIKNGYPAFFFQGGENAEVSITYFEKFMSETDKIRRDDAEHGKIIGLTDTVILKGGEVCYEPFWYRTFRLPDSDQGRSGGCDDSCTEVFKDRVSSSNRIMDHILGSLGGRGVEIVSAYTGKLYDGDIYGLSVL